MSVVDEVFEAVVADLNPTQPCEWDVLCEDNCSKDGSWGLSFKTECSHGVPTQPPHFVTLCDWHKKILLGMMTPWSNYVCLACGCNIADLNHLIARISKL